MSPFHEVAAATRTPAACPESPASDAEARGRAVWRSIAAEAWVDVGALACPIACSIFFAGWLTAATGSVSLWTVLLLCALPLILRRTGAMVTSLLGVASFFALDFLLGSVVVCTPVCLWKLVLPGRLTVIFTAVLLGIVVLSRLLPWEEHSSDSTDDVLAVLVSLAAATAWSQDLLRPVVAANGAWTFKPWTDFFTHASLVARMLQDQSLLDVGNYEWRGYSAPPYHYASYVLPALLSDAGGVPAYEVVTAFWAPFGALCSGLAAYALGRSSFGHGPGLAALVAVLLIPDASLLGFGHPAFGYYWLQFVAPAGLYGVAIAATALILIADGVRRGRKRCVVAGITVGLLVVIFKAHVAAAALPILVAIGFLAWPAGELRPTLRFVLFLACLVAVVSATGMRQDPRVAPLLDIDPSGSSGFASIMARSAPAAMRTWYAVLEDHPFPRHLPRAAALLYLSALGIPGLIAPFALLLSARRRRLDAVDWVPSAAIAVLMVMTFAFGMARQPYPAQELWHRPFVWAFFVVSALVASQVAILLRPRLAFLRRRYVVAGIVMLLAVPVVFGRDLQTRGGPWAAPFVNQRIDVGLIDSARFVRGRSPRDAIVQDSHLDADFLVVGGLSERPSFAARPGVWTAFYRTFRESRYRLWLARLDRLKRATTLSALQEAARDTGVCWYITHPQDEPTWPAAIRDHPAFESGGYKVYGLCGATAPQS